MPYTVTYNGNVASGGSVPVDNNSYASGAQVTVKNNLVERGWRERLRITVYAEADEPHRIRTIIVRERPLAFDAEPHDAVAIPSAVSRADFKYCVFSKP
jgi:hypothetical protein